jgi:hypothetical protein
MGEPGWGKFLKRFAIRAWVGHDDEFAAGFQRPSQSVLNLKSGTNR